MSNAGLYTLTVLIWGSTWFAIEFQLGIVAPEVSIVYRYAIASVVLFIYSKISCLPLSFNLKTHVGFAVLGLFLFCLNYILAYRAQLFVTSALAAIVFSTMLWMNIGLARIAFGTRAGGRVILGALLGIAGILTIFLPQAGIVGEQVITGCILAGLGALSASCGNIVSQKLQLGRIPVVQANAWGMAYGALITLAVVLIGGHEIRFEATFTYIASLLYLALFGSVVAFGAYLTLLGRIGAHRAGYATVMFPVVALILSLLFEGLHLEATIVLGTALVLTGNVLVLRERQ